MNFTKFLPKRNIPLKNEENYINQLYVIKLDKKILRKVFKKMDCCCHPGKTDPGPL